MNKQMFEIQNQIRQNAVDMQSMVTDLGDWASEMDKKDKNVKKGVP